MRSFLTAIIFMFLSIQLFSQARLALDEAINIALHKNSFLLTATNNLESVESNLQAAWGNFLPSLGLNANWDYSESNVEGVGTVVINGIPIPRLATTTTSRNYRGSVYSNWTLFDGLSNFATLSQSENNLESAEFSLERIKQDIVFQTMTLYYNIVYTKQLLKVKDDDLKWNEKNLETIKERNRLGAATLADVYQQEVATGSAELEIINTQNQLATAEKDLLFYLGLDVLEEYTFSDTLTAAEVEILNTNLLSDFDDMTETVDAALNQRFDFKSAILNLESAKDGVSIAQSGHWPYLIASGNYSMFTDNISNLDQTRTLSFGLSLNFPIFEGWSVSDRVQFAEVQAKNSEIELNDLERDIKRQLKITFLDLQASQKGLLVSQNNVAAARENLKIEEEKYSLGSGKLLDVLIANSRYTTALTDLINAQFAYIVFSQQLKYQLGVLDYKQYEQ
ncbi:MAG: TolC family protein [Ignavibacteria bacterium]|nr:TolC family protein [Ignavibacteria bacterium]